MRARGVPIPIASAFIDRDATGQLEVVGNVGAAICSKRQVTADGDAVQCAGVAVKGSPVTADQGTRFKRATIKAAQTTRAENATATNVQRLIAKVQSTLEIQCAATAADEASALQGV